MSAQSGQIHARQKAWLTAQSLLRRLHRGEPVHRLPYSLCDVLEHGVSIHAATPIRQAKNAAIILVSLITREALEQGLALDAAYALGDRYVEAVECCATQAQILTALEEMCEKYASSLNNARVNHYTKPILSCCTYIHLHVEDKLTVDVLARHVSYTPYYLTKKFRAETGTSLKKYIQAAKIERAKLLLATTHKSIQDISEQLCFSSRSYFTDTFHRATGMPPAEYRQRAVAA